MSIRDNRIVQSYLFFDGRCDEAIEFYKKALGAQVERLMRFKDSPEAPPPGCAPSPGEKVMHAQIKVGDTIIMLSDGRCSGNPKFEGFGLALTVNTVAEADRYFKALAEGGKVQMPLAKTFFSPSFGMVFDKFGINWMVLVAPTTGK